MIEGERRAAAAQARKLPPLRKTAATALYETVVVATAGGAQHSSPTQGDIVIVCGTPPVRYHAHRAVMSASSLFFENAIEQTHGKILVLENAGFATCMPRLLRHIYTPDPTEFTDTADALHMADAANYYALDNLCKECTDFVKYTICIKNSLRVWATGYRLGRGNPHGDELMRLSHRQLVYTLADATAVPELKDLPRHALEALLMQVGGHRNSNADAKVECLLRWAQLNQCTARQVSELLSGGVVDLSMLTSDGFRFATCHAVVKPHADIITLLARGFAERPSRRRAAVDLLPNATQRRKRNDQHADHQAAA